MKGFTKKEESKEIGKARLELKQQKEYVRMAKSNLEAAIREDKIVSTLNILNQAIENIERTKK